VDLEAPRRTVGSQIVPGDEMHSLRNVIILVLIAVILKNLLVWIAGSSARRSRST